MITIQDSAPSNASKRLRTLQLIDLLGQIACFLIGSYTLGRSDYSIRDDGWLAGLFLDNRFGLLFRLGAWQLLSALLHLLVWKQLPGRKQGRRIHLFVVAFAGILLAVTLLGEGKSDDDALIVLFGLLLAAPVLAALYFCITALELWKLSIANSLPEGLLLPEKNRRVAGQALLLMVALTPIYRFPFAAGGFWLTLYPLALYTSILVLTLWLLAGYLKARRLKQVLPLETICAGWTAVLLIFYLINALLPNPIWIRFLWLGLLLNPKLVLALWYVASLWRGPLQKLIETVPVFPESGEQEA